MQTAVERSFFSSWLPYPAATVLIGVAAVLMPDCLRARGVAVDIGFNAPMFTSRVQAARVVGLPNRQFLTFASYSNPCVGFDRVSGVVI